MNILKSKFTLAGVLLSGSCQVSAHTGNHGIFSWHHYVASADHAAVFLLLVLAGLGVLTYFARKPAGNRTLVVRK
jgi:hypothetical protein